MKVLFSCRSSNIPDGIASSVWLRSRKSQTRDLCFSEEAVKAMIDASKIRQEQLIAVFGPIAKQVLSSGDPVEDREVRKRFLNAYDAKNALISEGDTIVVLQVGTEGWPFPIPLVKKNQGWFFDTRKGEKSLATGESEGMN